MMMNYRNARFKRQRNKMNKYITAFNKDLKEDTLFPNRFVIREKFYFYHPYEDGSGCTMNVVYEITDLTCRNTATFVVNNYDYVYETFKYINDFVIRCRDGQPGHFPVLPWVTMDIQEVRQ